MNTIEDMIEVVQNVWDNLSLDTIRNTIEHTKKVIKSVLKKKGDYV